MRHKNRKVGTIIFILTGLFVTHSATAQPIWLEQSNYQSIALEVLKPKKDNTTFLSSTFFLSLRLPVRDNLIFVGELPFAHGQQDFENIDTEAKNKIGNIYLGFDLLRQDSLIFIEAGLRLPLVTSSNIASIFGQLSDVDRLEAFIPDVVTVFGTINFPYIFPSHLFFRLRSGPSLIISTGEGGFGLLTTGNDSELCLIYSGQIGYDGDKVNLSGGLTGRLLVTEEGNIGRRTFLQLGLNARLTVGNFRPGIHVRIPLEDDLKEVLDFVIGLNLGFRLQKPTKLY